MSGYIVEEFWHLNSYRYVYPHFALEEFCREEFKKQTCLMLDAGCGPRICSLSWVPKNVSVVGVDMSRGNVLQSCMKAKEKGCENFSFVVASVTCLPFRDKTFDLYVSAGVLEHVKNNREAIKEASRVSKLEGKFVASTTNLLNPIIMFDSLAPKTSTKAISNRLAGKHYERQSRLTVSKLVRILIQADFQLNDLKLLGFPLFQPSLYQFSNRKPPWFAGLWIISNRLTEKKPLNLLKEIVVLRATKNPLRHYRI